MYDVKDYPWVVRRMVHDGGVTCNQSSYQTEDAARAVHNSALSPKEPTSILLHWDGNRFVEVDVRRHHYE